MALTASVKSQAVIFAAVGQNPIFDKGQIIRWLSSLRMTRVIGNEFLGELKVSFIMTGNSHDHAGSVTGDDIVRPDRHAFAGQGGWQKTR